MNLAMLLTWTGSAAAGLMAGGLLLPLSARATISLPAATFLCALVGSYALLAMRVAGAGVALAHILAAALAAAAVALRHSNDGAR